MKANKLRLGNLINYGEGIAEVDLKILSYIYEDSQDDAFQPIPLTEEWLLKFGFEYDSNHTSLFFDKTHSILETRPELDYYVFIPFCTNDEDCYIKIKYVHQLQNLVHDLTGEELILKQ